MSGFIDELKRAMAGWTVVDIIDHDDDESFAEFVLEQDTRERRVQVCATDMGAWVRSLKESVKGDVPVYCGPDAVHQLLTDITNHLFKHDLIDEEGCLGTVDLPERLAMGFQCPQTGTDWLIHIRSIKGHRLSPLFHTSEGRREVVRRLTNGIGYPYAFPELEEPKP